MTNLTENNIVIHVAFFPRSNRLGKKIYFETLFCYFWPSGNVQVLEKTIHCGEKDRNLCKYIRLIQNFVGLLSCYNCRPAEKLIKIESEVTDLQLSAKLRINDSNRRSYRQSETCKITRGHL